MKRDLILLAVVGAEPFVGGSLPLQVLFTADFDPAQGAFQVPGGDEIAVVVAIDMGTHPPKHVEFVQVNILSWPAPGKKEQLFSSCFRENPDTPDAAILASGRAELEPFVLDGPWKGYRYPESQEPLPTPARLRVFRMRLPRFLILEKPGVFTVYISLTVRLETKTGSSVLQTFTVDPEMNVMGSYPPDNPLPL